MIRVKFIKESLYGVHPYVGYNEQMYFFRDPVDLFGFMRKNRGDYLSVLVPSAEDLEQLPHTFNPYEWMACHDDIEYSDNECLLTTKDDLVAKGYFIRAAYQQIHQTLWLVDENYKAKGTQDD